MAPKNSSNPSWQILGICKSTLHRPFYTRLLREQSDATSDCECMSIREYLLWLLCYGAKLSVEKLCSANLRKRPQHVYASVANEFIRVHTDFRYAGDSAACLWLRSVCQQKQCSYLRGFYHFEFSGSCGGDLGVRLIVWDTSVPWWKKGGAEPGVDLYVLISQWQNW